MAALLVCGIVWAHGKAQAELCTGIDVIISNADSSSLVTEQGIKDKMNRLGLKGVGKPVSKVNVHAIETKLRELEYLESAECYMSPSGRLIISVKQIVPVLRVFDGNKSYYVNHDGKLMHAVAEFHADVPVVTGNFSAKYKPTRLLPMVEYIEKDPTLKSLVTLITVRDSNNIFITPSISGHVVNMGPATDFENKFKKLTAFYKNVLPHKGYDYYDTISVKWSHQVVATKRIKAVKVELPVDTAYVDETPFDIVADDVAPVAPADTTKKKK